MLQANKDSRQVRRARDRRMLKLLKSGKECLPTHEVRHVQIEIKGRMVTKSIKVTYGMSDEKFQELVTALYPVDEEVTKV